VAGAYVPSAGLDVRVEDAVLRLALNAPERRNALNDESMAALMRALEQAGTDDQLRAVLLEGAGANFCSGFDIVARNAGGPTVVPSLGGDPPEPPYASPARAASSAGYPPRRTGSSRSCSSFSYRSSARFAGGRSGSARSSPWLPTSP
jgi:hypothetical protein